MCGGTGSGLRPPGYMTQRSVQLHRRIANDTVYTRKCPPTWKLYKAQTRIHHHNTHLRSRPLHTGTYLHTDVL